MTHTPQEPLDDDTAPDDFPEESGDELAVDAADDGDGERVPEVGAVLESVDELKKVLAAELSTDTTQHYLNQIGTRPLLTAPQEVHYATLAKAGDFSARQTMIEHNLRLVVSIAKHYINRGVVLLDMIEEGNIGLMRAIMNRAGPVRLPVQMVRELNQILRGKYRLEARHHNGKDATAEDIAELVGRPVEEVQDILALSEHATSLDAPLDNDPQSSLMDMLPGASEDSPDARAEHHEMTVLVRDWLTKLPDKQRIVIMRRFGLDNDDPATLETLAEEMGVTRERVRQIQQEALIKLKRAMAARGVVRDSLL